MVVKASAAVFVVLLMFSFGVAASPCEAEDFLTEVSGGSECLLMRRYGSVVPSVLVVWLHGNVSTGGPANSHFKFAEATATTFESEQILAVALVRPGYPDGTGKYSSGSDNGRADNWRRQTIADIGTAIERIKKQFHPKTTLIVGHSGGAAITAVLLGLQPDLIDAAILIGCPCDMLAWRAGRSRTMWISEDPLAWVNQVNPHTRITALTGDQDNTTAPALAIAYISRLQERGIKATFISVPGAGHIDVIKSQAVMDAISELIH
jgi:pimeloyl-ACP methyl ester carboxylesterase